MGFGITFSPLVSNQVLWACIAVAAIVALLLLVIRSRGAWIRAGALAFAALALANPSLTREDREALPSVAVVVVDKSPSQSLRRPREADRGGARRDDAAARPHRGPRSARGRGRTGRRRDRRHAPVLGARRGPGRRAAGPRRGRAVHHRRARARRAERSGAARLQRAGACADHRTAGRARPPHPARHRAALRHRRADSRPSCCGSRTRARRPGRCSSPSAATASCSRPATCAPATRCACRCRSRMPGRTSSRSKPRRWRDELTTINNRAVRGDRRRARQAARAARLGRAACGRAHLAQPAEVRRLGRSRALHHPASAREAGRHADQRALADRVSDARAVPAEDQRIPPDHLRPLRPPGRAADHLFRQHRALCARRRRRAGRGRTGLREPDLDLAHAARRGAAGRAERAHHRDAVLRAAHRSRQAPPGDARARRRAKAIRRTGAAGSAWSMRATEQGHLRDARARTTSRCCCSRARAKGASRCCSPTTSGCGRAATRAAGRISICCAGSRTG